METIEEVSPLLDISTLKEGDYFYHNDYDQSFFKFIRIHDEKYILSEKIDNTSFDLISSNYLLELPNFAKKIQIIKDEYFINNVENFRISIGNMYRVLSDIEDDYFDYKKRLINFEDRKQRSKFIEVLKHHFDEDHYEINKVGSELHFILKYDDITIENSEDRSHFIKSLFVKLKFNTNSNTFSDNMEGYRGEMSIKELCSSYFHSHLSTHTSNFQSFCLGASELGILLSDLHNKQFNQDSFDLLLYTISEYVKWESLTGGPYIKIKDLSYSTSRTTLNSINVDDTNKTIKAFIDSKSEFNTKFNFSTNSIEVVKDEQFVKNITNLIPNRLKVIMVNDTTSPICDMESTKRSAVSKLGTLTKFSFKGKMYPCLYEEPEFQQLNNQDNIEAHPLLVDKVKKHLEQKINSHFLKQLNEKV